MQFLSGRHGYLVAWKHVTCEYKVKIVLKENKNNKRCIKTCENFRTPGNILGFVRQGEIKHRNAANYISQKVLLMP